MAYEPKHELKCGDRVRVIPSGKYGIVTSKETRFSCSVECSFWVCYNGSQFNVSNGPFSRKQLLYVGDN